MTTCSRRCRSPWTGEARFELELQRQVLLFEERLDRRGDLADHGVDVDLLVAPLDPPGLHLGEVEEVVDERGEAFTLGDDDVEVAATWVSGPLVAGSGSGTAG